MADRFCKKCNHLCHCIEADNSDCKCENCECMQREEDKTFESSPNTSNFKTGEVIIDDTGECESCQ